MKTRATRLLIVAALLTSQLAFAGVADGFVSGLINVRPRVPTLVSNELGSTLFAGHAVSIELSGEVDINAADRWEEECFIGICKKKTWVDHYWHKATQWPTEFRLVDETGQVVADKLFSQNGRVDFVVPEGSLSLFNRKVRLEGLIVDSSPSINPSRSQGQYSARITVTTARRANALNGFLSAQRSTASELRAAWTYDPFFVNQNRTFIARSLVAHAKNHFPPSAPTSRHDHKALLEYAQEIDSSSEEVSFAVADMYLSQDDAAGAEKEMITLIKNLRLRPGAGSDPVIQLSLAQAHLKLASVIEAARGYAEQTDLAAISANYTAALEIAGRFRAPTVKAEALLGRAVASRSRNTASGLAAAINDFKAARDSSPVRMRGVPRGSAPGGEELLVSDGDSITGVGWRSVQANSTKALVVEAGNAQLLPRAVSRTGRVFATSPEAVGWIDLGNAQPEFKVVAAMNTARLGRVVTNGRASLVTLMPSSLAAPYETLLYREDFSSSAVTIDGAAPFGTELAAQAQRYLVTALKAPTIHAELREIHGGSGESTVRRVQLPQGQLLSMRVAADGRSFGGLFTIFAQGGPPKRALMIWDDAGNSFEISSQAFPSPGQALSPDVVEAFEISPDGKRVILTTADGALRTAEIRSNAKLVTLMPALASVASPIRNHTFSWASTSTLIVDVMGMDAKLTRRVVEWPHLQVQETQVPVGTHMSGGYWKDSNGVIGSVHVQPMPFRIRSIRTSDASMIGESKVSDLLGGVALLKGGRYACIQRASISIQDMIGQSETLVAKENSTAESELGHPMCLPTMQADGWVLVRQEGGKIRSLAHYKGATLSSASNVLPGVPDDIIAMEKAAAARLGVPYVAPAFLLPQFVLVPGQVLAGMDGRMVVAAIPNAAWQEAMAQPTTKWVSVPVLMLQEAATQIRRVRLPAGALPVKVLDGETNKVIYVRGRKIFWKDIATDTDGTPLFDLPPMPGPGPSQARQPIQEVRTNPAGTRVIFGDLGFLFADPTVEVEQRVFEASPSGISAASCGGCSKRSIDWRPLLADGQSVSPMLWGTFQADSALNYLVSYGPTQTLVYDVSANKPIAMLPYRQVVWIGAKGAFYLSGRNEFSFVKY